MSVGLESKPQFITSVYVEPVRSGRLANFAVLLVWCAVAVIAAFAIWSIQPPAAAPASAPAESFSAERAMAHVRAIAIAPHPVGSAAEADVRRYLIEQLNLLGLQPQVYSSVGVNVIGASVVAGEVQDIVARLKGSAGSRAILLMAHYDSAKHAPGAADDGAGLAAILETIRALRAGPPLQNDVIVLFTDSEETGLLGAQAFVVGHPWMKDIGLILNLEARGDRGPSLLFETSADNSKLIEEVRKAAFSMEGSSLFYSLYKLLPNKTDATIFRPTNIPMLNFAFGNRFEAYHTRLDTADNLSTASLQLQGIYALALSQRFGRLDLSKLQGESGDDVFFNPLGKRLIAYPESWALIAEIAITLVLLAGLFLQFRRSEFRGRGFLVSLLDVLIMAVALPLAMAAAWWLISSVFSVTQLFGDTLSNNLLFIGLLLLGILTAEVLTRFLPGMFARSELLAASLTAVCLLSWPLVVLLPAGSYLLQAPLALLALGFTASQLFRKTSGFSYSIAILPGWLCSILIFAPLLYLVYVFFALNYIVVIASGFILSLLALFSAPLFSITGAGKARRFAASGILAVATIGCLGLGIVKSRYSPESPKPDNLLYSLDADSRRAAWISFDREPDNWVSGMIPRSQRQHQPMPDYLANSKVPVWTAPGLALDLPAPLIRVVKDETSGDTRHLVLVLQSQRDAGVMHAALGPDITVASAKIAGKDVPLKSQAQHASENWTMALYGWGRHEINLDLEIKGNANPTLWLADESQGFPLSVPPRPSDLIAWYGSDITLVNTRLTFAQTIPGPQTRVAH